MDDDDMGMPPMDDGSDMGGGPDPMGGNDPMGGEDDDMLGGGPNQDEGMDDMGMDDDMDSEGPEDESTRHIMALLHSLPQNDKIAAERYIQSLTLDNGEDIEPSEGGEMDDMGMDDEGDMGMPPMDDGSDMGGGGNEPPQMKESFFREFNNVATSKRVGKRDYKKIGDNVNLVNNPFISSRR